MREPWQGERSDAGMVPALEVAPSTALRSGLPVSMRDVDLLRVVVQGAPVVIWAIDNDGTFMLSEGRGLEALGLKPGEVVGERLWDVYADFPHVIAEVRRAMRGRAHTGGVEVAGTHFESHYAPIHDDDGRQIGLIGISTDVTDRVVATRELALSQAETIDRLALAVGERSHETAGHIRRMSGYAALLAERIGLEQERCELIRQAAPMHDIGRSPCRTRSCSSPGRCLTRSAPSCGATARPGTASSRARRPRCSCSRRRSR